jgi:predicted HTH domain antitoxin
MWRKRVDTVPEVPEEAERYLRELKKEDVREPTAVRKILECRKERALELLGRGKITFARAAEMAGVFLWEMLELVRDRKIEWVHLSPEEIEREFGMAKKRYGKT